SRDALTIRSHADRVADRNLTWLHEVEEALAARDDERAGWVGRPVEGPLLAQDVGRLVVVDGNRFGFLLWRSCDFPLLARCGGRLLVGGIEQVNCADDQPEHDRGPCQCDPAALPLRDRGYRRLTVKVLP